jgi:hypothetical protein
MAAFAVGTTHRRRNLFLEQWSSTHANSTDAGFFR